MSKVQIKSEDEKIGNKLLEYSVVKHISTYLKELDYDILHEVPNMGQSVDIVGQKGRWLTFIEVKINNWNRAFDQCKTHELVADFIFIGIATKKVSEQLKIKAKEKGYGIIHFNPNNNLCEFIIKPSLNKKIWLPQREILLSKIQNIKKYGCPTLDDVWNIC
ncbi:hypothetical protein SIO70_06845 [Chitinophaga sancti]|uniref:hypothetical protein n=1 Tax=Chitinophaga sancti TaxID=1004 RepID=UPI002A74F94A|nr:hypothetical protein [Chitinophaga sancti]WPQ64582.1 hypothetical protein SIO70_06845 [Chitinophaga sancti]